MTKKRTRMSSAGRWFATSIGIAVIAGLSAPATPAHADPGPSFTAAKKQLAALNDQVDQLDNQYNKAVSDYKAAKGRLNALSASVEQERKTFQSLRTRVAQLAVEAYKTGDNGTLPQLVSAKDPEAVLNQMSVFTQLAHNRSIQFNDYLASAQRLEREGALRQQAVQQLAARKSQLEKQRTQIESAVSRQMALVHKLGGNIDPGSSVADCSALAFGRAETVLKFACAQLGKSYVFGAAGPDHYDCSGLTMVAFAKVGIHLHHWVPDQYSASRRVSKADLQPGDMVFFENLGHVGIYLGNGKFIQAPHTGDVVKVSSLNDGWYASSYVGAGRLL